jgi:hypothetical protein
MITTTAAHPHRRGAQISKAQLLAARLLHDAIDAIDAIDVAAAIDVTDRRDPGDALDYVQIAATAHDTARSFGVDEWNALAEDCGLLSRPSRETIKLVLQLLAPAEHSIDRFRGRA